MNTCPPLYSHQHYLQILSHCIVFRSIPQEPPTSQFTPPPLYPLDLLHALSLYAQSQTGLMMASSPPTVLHIAVIVMLIFSLTSIPSKSVGLESLMKQNKLVLGSRPPRCVNRCLSCRPCMAVLVIPPHHRDSFKSTSRGDESYYLLSWKCRCGAKYFQP